MRPSRATRADEATPPFTLPRAAWAVLVAALLAATAWQWARVGVNQDVRQTLGVLRAGDAGGFGATEVWAHRPLATRWLMAFVGLFAPADPVVADRVARILASLVAAAAAAALGHGLRRALGRRGAALVALAVAGALLLAPTWDFAEPEWWAAAGAVGAIGLALSAGRRTGAVLAGVLLGVVAALKYTTLTTALVAVGVVWLLDSFRGRWTAWSAAVSTVALVGASLWLVPHEWQWLRDMPLLNPAATSALPLQLAEGWANHVLVSPVTLVALTVLTDLAIRGRGRSALAAYAGLALLAVPFAVQHQGFLYHLAPVPVLAAAIVAAGCVRGHLLGLVRGVPWTWIATVLIGTLAGIGVFAAAPRAREGLWWIGLALTALAIALPVAETALTRRGAPHLLPLAVAPLLVAPLLVPLSPRTAYSVSLAHARVTAATNRQQARDAAALARRVAPVLPPSAPVVHLGFSTPWQLPNPSACRYVSPTFLQRGRLPGVRGTESYRENLACLADPAAQYAVLEKDWFAFDRVPPEVAEAVRRAFPCAAPVYEDATVRVCRRG